MNTIWAIFSTEEVTVYLNNTYDGNLWSTGKTTPEININTPGNYSVTVFLNQANSSDVRQHRNLKILFKIHK